MKRQAQRASGRLRRKRLAPQTVRESPKAFFRRLDRRVLELSEDVGSDLSKPHEISFWMYLPTEESAYGLAPKLQAQGFDVEVSPPLEGRNDWLCLAYLIMVPDPDELEMIRGRLTELVEQRGGKYDGWEMCVTG